MASRKDSFFSGISAKFFSYGLSIARDINGRSKGYITNFTYGKLFIISSKFLIRTGVGLEWFDDRYAEYYFGVRQSEARLDRSEYHVNNYFQLGFNVLPIYKISEKISVVSALGVKSIPNNIRFSPTLNGDKLDFGGLFAINYQL